MMDKIKAYLCPDSIKIVFGKKFGLIMDLQRSSYIKVDYIIVNFISLINGKSINEIKLIQTGIPKSYLQPLIKYLISRDILIFTGCVNQFKCINNEFSIPYAISNMIIELSIQKLSNLKLISQEINSLNVWALEIRWIGNITPEIFEVLLNKINLLSIRHLSLIIEYQNFMTNEYLIKYSRSYLRLNEILIHSCPEERYFENEYVKINFVKSEIRNIHCGNISTNYFVINWMHYTESLSANNCLNKKISIDLQGNIKNCPSLLDSFGNIEETSLAQAIEKPGFKKYWNIKKEDILICKDCEFRFVCTDCRAYLDDPQNIYSKPLKCGYNPDTGEWADWSTNPLKAESIKYYGMDEIFHLI